jgi:molecular chaperone HtpG
LPKSAQSDIEIEGDYKSEIGITFHYRILLNNSSNINPRIELSDISTPYSKILGCAVLSSAESQLFGLRNGFGLSQIPLQSAFGLGGIVNLINLVPTAGRDAISKSSIDFVSKLIYYSDQLVALNLSRIELADNSRELIQYIKNTRFLELADNIKIGIANSDERIALGAIRPEMEGKKVMYYAGVDKTLIDSYEDRDNIILVPSNDRNRRYVQLMVLRNKQIKEIADKPIVSKIIQPIDLTSEELSIAFKIKAVVEDDYLVQNCIVDFAEISHGLSLLVNKECDSVHIYLKRDSSDLGTLKEIYQSNYSLFEPFIKDFVRTRVYSKIAPFIPSSQKDGADALYDMLQRKKELYTIESSELGSMEYILNEYLQGRAEAKDVLIAASREKKKQTQILESGNIGNAQDILGRGSLSGNLMDTTSDGHETVHDFEPAPSILRLDTNTQYKILATDEESDIEGYRSFVALSERLDRDYRDFFFQPHTTRVIWSMHKIIYIFTHASGSLTLYYEMELRKKLSDNATGGRAVKTATIVTQNRIFVPIISELHDYFDIKSGKLTFMVHYDSVRN